MKRIRTLRDTQHGLVAYLEMEADDASWDRCGDLPAFFTTARSFFGPVAEAVLGEHPQTWI